MLLLTAPIQHIAENPAVECDPKRVKLWLAELPTSDVHATVSQLVMALKPFNELQLAVKTRLKLLEIYHAYFETILCTFDEIHLRSLPLDHKQRRGLSEDIMWVYLELANGYKSIVKSVYEDGQDKPTQDDILISIYRGIELIANALVYAFCDHQTPPPLLYLEIHQLYYLAEQLQLETKNISSIKNQARNPTIEHLYKRIMLLIASDAYTYGGNEIIELYELLDQYTDDAQLLCQPDGLEKSYCYFIDFTEDQIPRSCPRVNTENLLPMQRILVVDNTAKRIVADLEKDKNCSLESIRGAELRLLRSFIANLHRSRIIREPRHHRHDNARIAYGLDAVCYYLEHRDRFVETAVEVVNGIEVRDLDIFEAEHELQNWQVSNATPTGRMLIAEEHEDTYIKVGEVVSIVEQISAKHEPLIHTGLLRWQRYCDGKILMGFEIIDGMPMKVECQPLLTDSDEESVFHALYFPSNKATKKPASLLFDYSHFRQAKNFKVEVAGQHYRIEAVKIFRESPVYVQFGFRVIN